MKTKLNPCLEDELKLNNNVILLSDLEIDEDFVEEWNFRYRLVYKKRGNGIFKTKKSKQKRCHSNLVKHTVKNAPRSSFKKIKKRF